MLRRIEHFQEHGGRGGTDLVDLVDLVEHEDRVVAAHAPDLAPDAAVEAYAV